MNILPIKFRGVRIDGNGYAYGNLEYMYSGREIWIDGWQVYPYNVAKLCGYDGDGHEVYEGDTLIDQHGTAYTVALKGFAVADDDIIPLNPDDKNLPRLLLIPKE